LDRIRVRRALDAQLRRDVRGAAGVAGADDDLGRLSKPCG
jgi:hypothetical protein